MKTEIPRVKRGIGKVKRRSLKARRMKARPTNLPGMLNVIGLSRDKPGSEGIPTATIAIRILRRRKIQIVKVRTVGRKAKATSQTVMCRMKAQLKIRAHQKAKKRNVGLHLAKKLRIITKRRSTPKSTNHQNLLTIATIEATNRSVPTKGNPVPSELESAPLNLRVWRMRAALREADKRADRLSTMSIQQILQMKMTTTNLKAKRVRTVANQSNIRRRKARAKAKTRKNLPVTRRKRAARSREAQLEVGRGRMPKIAGPAGRTNKNQRVK
mmetsp:Transcript_48507/g.101346  ORF Transcript_48507/g.101346 Transcript_48507/m.101346 type:complete len:270 (+) Transcript_48507:881-1690(+)